MSIPVIVNRSGGTASSMGEGLGDTLDKAFGDAGLAIDLHLVEGKDIADTVARFADRELVVVGGGDGTLGTAAQQVMGTGATLGILPLGTRNHLALEIGVPAKLEEAAKLIAAGHARAIDLAEVNDRVFVNNASIGLYPLMVRRRDAERRRTGVPKWLAALPAARDALRRLPHHRLRIDLHGEERRVVTPLLFVGNNRYELSAGQVGKRATLDDGVLSVYAVASRRRLALIGFALRTLVGLADPAQDFVAIGETAEMTVTGASDGIDVALDGEVARFEMPLRFKCLPGALRVIAPAESGLRSH